MQEVQGIIKMEENLRQFAEKIKNFKSTYLAGGIQARKNPNRWRLDLVEFFGENNIRVINPVADNQEIFSPSVMGYKDDGKPYTINDLIETDHEKRIMLFKQTEENDLVFMQQVDLQIFYMDESAGFGTWTEYRENYNNFKKPVIMVKTIKTSDLPHWVEWRYFKLLQNGNAIEFKSFPEMKEFFVNYLKFKK